MGQGLWLKAEFPAIAGCHVGFPSESQIDSKASWVVPWTKSETPGVEKWEKAGGFLGYRFIKGTDSTEDWNCQQSVAARFYPCIFLGWALLHGTLNSLLHVFPVEL